MFHRFPFLGLGFWVFLFCLQVETIQGSSGPPQQNVPPSSHVSHQNIPAFPFDAAEATVWRIPLRHQNASLLLNALWAIHEAQNMYDAVGRGHWLISVQRDGLVDVAPAWSHEFPYKVYLSRNNNNNNSFFCGGSIISEWLILTAAHCLISDDLIASSLVVTAGVHGDLSSRPSGLEQVRVVDEIVVHPNYTRGGGEHQDNIAILVLKEPLSFSAAVRSIGLPNRECIFWGKAIVSGWGSSSTASSSGDPPSSGVLKKVTAPIIPNTQCNSQYANSNVRITEQLFCAEEEGLVSCQGDSGGPAVCRSGGWGLQRSSVLCGIVSLREGGCGLISPPGVYVQVSKYIDWISGTLQNRKLDNHSCLPDGGGGGVSPSNGTDSLTACVSKYLLPERGISPYGVEEEPGFLLLTNPTSLLRVDVNQTELGIEQLPLLGSARNNPTSVEFDVKNNVLYWVDNYTTIKRLYVNGNGHPEVLLSSNEAEFGGLAFDWMSRNLYFTDSNTDTIEVIRTDGVVPSEIHGGGIMRKRFLGESQVQQPWGIAVHPAKGYIFWADLSGFIGRAHLDGSQATIIVWIDWVGPKTPFTLDLSEDRIYWVDSKLDRMKSADLNGDDKKTVLKSDSRISAAESLGIYKNIVYWTDDGDTKALYKAPLQDDNKTVSPNSIVEIMGDLGGYPRDMIVYGGASQQGGDENPCTSSRCRYICMASPAGPQRTVSCICPDGLACHNNDDDTMEHGVTITTPSNGADLTKGVPETETTPPPCGVEQDPRLLFVTNNNETSVWRMDLNQMSLDNVPALFPFDAALSLWSIPFGHPNSTHLLEALWAIQESQNVLDATGRGHWLISIERDGFVDVTPARPHEFPYKVYLSRNNNINSYFCGGSIISEWLILTAANCLPHDADLNASSLMVTAGLQGHLSSQPSGLEQIRVVNEIVVHPNYTRGGGGHHDNIAILVLKEPLSFSTAAVRSIGLPNRECIFWGKAIVSGWGSSSTASSSGDPPSSGVLKKVTAPIIPNTQCNSQYANSNVTITEQLFCAEEEGLVSCQGDSGGPAVCRSGGWGLQRSSVLCGIVSLREGGCGHVAPPGVYVRVSKYVEWISETLRNLKLENHCLLDGGGGDVSPSNGTDSLTACVSKYLLPERGIRRPYGVEEEEEPGFLLLANPNSLLRIDINRTEQGIEQLSLLGSALGNNSTSVEFDVKNNILYWVDNNNTTIKRLYVNGNGYPEVLLSSNEAEFSGLAFDWTSGNLYFANINAYTIEVIRTDGVGVVPSAIHGGGGIMRKRLLRKPQVVIPWGIAVHPAKGYIFWADLNGFIGRAHLDGSQATKIVRIHWVGLNTPFTLDLSEGRIYWVDNQLDRVKSADLNGDDKKTVLKLDARIGMPLAVAIYRSTVYWTDGDTKALYKAPLEQDDDNKTLSPNSIFKIIGDLGDTTDMRVYGGASQQEADEHPCTNSRCPYICMASPGPQRIVSCVCPDGFTCQNDTMMEHGVTITTPSNDGADLLTKGVSPETETTTTPLPCGVEEDPRLLFVTNGTSVLRMDMNPRSLEQVPLGGSSIAEADASCVEFDLQGNILYWIDSGKTSIKRLYLNGSIMEPEVLVSSSNGSSEFTGLAFDWMSRNLYFTDAQRSTIEVIRTDNNINNISPEKIHAKNPTLRKRLLKPPHVRKPTGIAVHPAEGYIFWTDGGAENNHSRQNSFIGRARLDGSRAMRIVANAGNSWGNNNNTQEHQLTLETPTGITLDYSENRIYWVDSGLGGIMTADLNGDDVLQADFDYPTISEPISVGIYKGTVYWTDGYDATTTTLFQAPLQRDKTISPTSISRIVGDLIIGHTRGDMKVYGGASQKGENLCTHSSNCSYICMVAVASSPAPHHQRTVSSCLCPDGFTKPNNGDTKSKVEDDALSSPCKVEEEPGFLLVINDTSVFWRIDLDQMSVEEALFPRAGQSSENNHHPSLSAFDVKNKVLYWVKNRNEILRLDIMNMKGSSSSPEVLLVSSKNGSAFTGLAFDWMSSNLYFISYYGKRAAIEVIRTDQGIASSGSPHGSIIMRKALVTTPDLNRPRGIAVHPAKGYIFWADWSAIGRAHLDGSHACKIVSLPEYDFVIQIPEGIAVDSSGGDRIYWVEYQLNRMMTADLDGRDMKMVLQAEDGRFGWGRSFGVYKNTVYWRDGVSKELFLAPLRDDKTVSPKSILKIIVDNNNFSPVDLVVYGVDSQQGENPCTNNNSNCSYICMAISPPGRQRRRPVSSCLCPDGFTSDSLTDKVGDDEYDDDDDDDDDDGTTPLNGADFSTECVPARETPPPCELEGEEDPGLSILVTNGTSVLRIDFNQQTGQGQQHRAEQGPTVGLGSPITSLEFDLKSHYLYWVDDNRTAVKRAQMNGNISSSHPEVLLALPNRFQKFTGLALDWMSHNLYFTHVDALRLTIEVMRTDNLIVSSSSTSHEQKMSKHLLRIYDVDRRRPSKIAVHPAKGYIFWNQCDSKVFKKRCSIRRAHLDGSNEKPIVSHGNVETGGLTVDTSADRIYWMSIIPSRRIMSAGLNGESVKIVLPFDPKVSGLSSPLSFAVYGNRVYWTDGGTRELYRAPLQHHGRTISLKTKCRVLGGLSNPTILKVYGAGSQQGENLCTNSNSSTNNNNNCSFICMASPPGPQASSSCLCPTGFAKQNDTACV